MLAHQFIQQLRNQLNEETQPWVIIALRQDQTVWQALLETNLAEKALNLLKDQPMAWSPGMLAILAMDLDLELNSLQAAPMIPINPELRQRAYQAYESLMNGLPQNHSPAASISPLEALAEAGWAALALRERFHSTGSWDIFIQELLNKTTEPVINWLTISACLFGLIPDPTTWMSVLIYPGAPVAGVTIALHAFLSNPMPLAQQLGILKSVLLKYSSDLSNASDLTSILRALSFQHPTLVRDLSSWLLDLGNYANLAEDRASENGGIEHIEKNVHLAEIFQAAGQTDRALTLLTNAQKSAQWLQDGMSAYMSSLREPFQTKLLQAQQKVSSDPQLQSYLKEEAGDESTSNLQDDPEALIALAQKALDVGNISLSRDLANQALAIEKNKPFPCQYASFEPLAANLSRGRLEIFTALAKLLLDLGLYETSQETTQACLEFTPNDPELIYLHGKCLQALHHISRANHAYQVAAMLLPERLDIRSSLAEGLESIGDWDAALPERQNILSRTNPAERENLLEAYHKLANCALHAGKLELSILASKKTLAMDPNDGLAFVYLGEASLANPNLPDREQSALDYFNQAVMNAPQLPEAWLGLAKTYQKMDQESKASEVLKEAVQAAPLSYEVHFALGEAALSQGSLTQARQSLQKAYDLANSQSTPNGSKDWRVALRLGQVLLQLGHTATASDILSKAYHHPHLGQCKPLELASAHAKTLLALDQVSQAIPVLKEIVQSDDQDLDAHLDYAKALLSAGSDPEAAVQVLQRALVLDANHLEAQALLAEALAACGDYPGALKIFQTCLETELAKDRRWVARISFGLGCSALALNRIDTAIAALQEAIHADPAKLEYHQKLCEAYWAANLNNNAIQAARSALNLHTENPDTLMWFAEQAIRFYQASIPKNQHQNPENAGDDPQTDRLYGIKPRQILNEALNALTQAAQIDPLRAEILLKLGELQVQAGEKTQAVASFQKLRAFERISQAELQKAANWLTQLGEDDTAAECLERILSLYRAQGTDIPSDLFFDLCEIYQRIGNIEAAKDILEQALSIYPQQPLLYLKVAQIDVEANKPDQALEQLEKAATLLKENGDRAEIHYHIAQILRDRGSFAKALEQAELAFQLSESDEIHQSLAWTHLAKHSLVAELARSLLRPDQARTYLENPFPDPITAEQLDLSHREALNIIVGFFCLKSELALEDDEEIEAANALTPAVQAAPTHPRSLALQARFQHRRGDETLSHRTLQDALRQLPIPQEYGGHGSDNPPKILPENIPNSPVHQGEEPYSAADYHSLSEAAMELRLWDLAIFLIEKAIALSPKEPYLSLRKASIIVRQAEQQHLCQFLDILQHAPGESAISRHKVLSFQDALQMTRQSMQEQEASIEPNQLKPWEIRELAAFEDVKLPAGHATEKVELADPQCWNNLPPAVDTAAAEISFLLRKATQEQAAYRGVKLTHPDTFSQNTMQTCLDVALQASQKFSQSALVLLLAALAYESVQPLQALQLAQQAANLTKPTITDLTAMSQALLARLAYQTNQQQMAVQAIEMALSIWQDEPRWHALAAAISQMNGTNQDEITHLEFAAQLEPKNYTHHMNLGMAYVRRAENDPGQFSNALQSFEKASQLDPKRSEAWLSMAEIYLHQGSPADLMKAAEIANRAIAITLADPERKNAIPAQLLRAKIALKINDPELAYQSSQEALAVEPQNTEGIWLKTIALQNLNRPAEALSTLEKIAQTDYKPLHFQLKKAELLRQTQGSEAALTLTRYLAENNSNHPVVLSLYAQILLDTGQKEDALQAAQLALKFDAEQPELSAQEKSRLHYLIGMQSVESGQLDHAIHHLNEAILLTPDFVEPYLETGFAYNKQRQYLKAQKVFQQATVIAPEDPRPFLHAGLSLKEGKDYLSAETMLRRAAQLAPTDVQIRKHLAAVAALNLVHNPHTFHQTAER